MGDFTVATSNSQPPEHLKAEFSVGGSERVASRALTSACEGLQLKYCLTTRPEKSPPEVMIFKRTLLNALTFVTGGRGFITPGHKAFISLLLTPLLSVSCARPTARAGNRVSPLVYVALGDSTGMGLGARDGGGYVDQLFARIEQKRPGSTLLNLSVAGATTADVIKRRTTQLDGTRATLVTICVGVNDLLSGREAKQFAENYETLVAKLKQPGRLIVITTLPNVTFVPAMKGMADERLRARLGQFNKAIEAIAARHGAPLVDLYKLSGELAGSRPEFFSSDGLHPSDLGYALWAEAIWPVIARAIDSLSPTGQRESYQIPVVRNTVPQVPRSGGNLLPGIRYWY